MSVAAAAGSAWGRQITVRLPTVLAAYAEGRQEIRVSGRTLGAVIDALEQDYPELVSLLRVDGQFSPYLNLYLNRQNVRGLGGPATPVAPGDELMILLAVVGG